MRVGAFAALTAAAVLLGGCRANTTQGASGTAPDADRDWATYNGNPGGTHYSRLDQINTSNVAQLLIAWTYDSGDAFGEGESQSDMEGNPLIIRGRLVFVSPKGRIICLDGATGKERWAFDPAEARTVHTRQRSRGVAYWTDGREERILFTFRQNLMAVDMATGTLIRSFGTDGRVDLRAGLGRDPASISVTNVTPGVIYRDLLILGSTGFTPGDIRAYDVHTGKIRWTFHSIPHPGEPGYETWPTDAWQHSLGANVWAGLTLDPQSGTVFLPIASAGMLQKDFYGADRLGDNLFANSLVALDAATGKMRWHFQMVRHDLWDRDPPTQPTLVTVRRNGAEIPAVAQVMKSGDLYVLDRRTGESLFPLEERPVPASDVPGEFAAKTQIFPLAPAPFARQHLTADLLTQRTPEAHRAVAAKFAQYRSRGPYDPPSLQGTIIFPGFDGGAEWGGAAYDPQSGLLYVNSNEMAWILKLNQRAPAAAGTGGRAVYLNNCASCHGADRRGSPPEFPSLIDVGARLPQLEIAEQIRDGGGRMPAFGGLAPKQIAAVVQYLMDGRDTAGTEAVADSKTEPAAGNTNTFDFDGYKRFLDPDGYPAVAPPWGTLSAMEVSTARYAWKIPFGEYPELAAQGMKNTGSENYGGAVVTAGGLLFIGATNFDNKFHAFDKLTGRLLWETELPAAGNATPATYLVGHRQFVVIGAGGGKNVKRKNGGSLIAFALPEAAR